MLTQTLKGLNIWLFSLVYAAETGAQFSVMCTQLGKKAVFKNLIIVCEVTLEHGRVKAAENKHLYTYVVIPLQIMTYK